MSLDFLLEMGWKSAAICAVALCLLHLLRRRSAADRAAVLRLSVLLLLMLPLVSAVLPRLEVEAFQAPAAAPAPAVEAPAFVPAIDLPAPDLMTAPAIVEPEAATVSLGLSILLLYAAGAALVLARLLAGLWTLRRWTRQGEAPASPAWIAAFQAAVAAHPLKREVRLLVSVKVPSPMSWGWSRPVILIDRASHGRAADAEAILAHELAHVSRGDWPVLMLSRLAVALFWFNPLVWLVERALIQHAEEAADLQAVRNLEPARYARSLIACIRCSGLHAVPANGMARADGLARRVHAVLDGRLHRLPSGGLPSLIVMLAAVALAGPLSVLKLVPARAEAAPTPALAPLSAVAARPTSDASSAAEAIDEAVAEAIADVEADVEAADVAVDAAADARDAVLDDMFDARSAPPAIAAVMAPPAAPRPPLVGAVAAPPPPAAPAPPGRLDVDTLVALQIHGVDDDYVAAMQSALGRTLQARELLDMRIHGLTAARVRDLAALGYRLSHRDMMQMAVHDIRADYIRALAAAGYQHLTAQEIVQMRIHGVSAADAREGRRLGLTARQLLKRAITGE